MKLNVIYSHILIYIMYMHSSQTDSHTHTKVNYDGSYITLTSHLLCKNQIKKNYGPIVKYYMIQLQLEYYSGGEK